MQDTISRAEKALASLPHGKSFRFVDALTQLEPGVSGEGTYTITGEEDFLSGHFPGNPIMPAVIMVEALAQLGGIVAQADTRMTPLSELRLTAMKNVKIFDAALPKETLRLKVRIAGRLGNLIQLEGQIDSNSRMLVIAQLTLSGKLAETE